MRSGLQEVTTYPDLNEVLQELVESQRAILEAKFVGAYLVGSFAIGDFDRHSDVDYLVAIRDELSETELTALQAMHERIYHLPPHWAQHLEGSYFPLAVLRDHARCGEELWYQDNGSRTLERSSHCNVLVTRWTLHERGVTLAGPPPQTLLPPVAAKDLRREIYLDMLDWGQEILDHPEKFNNRFYQSFIVLSYCRMLHDMQTGSISSKRQSAAWAKETLDPQWRELIDRTWAARPDPATTVRQPADPQDFAATLKFVRYVNDLARKDREGD